MILTPWRYSVVHLDWQCRGGNQSTKQQRWTKASRFRAELVQGGSQKYNTSEARRQPCIFLPSATQIRVGYRRTAYCMLKNSSNLDFTCLYIHSHIASGSWEVEGRSFPTASHAATTACPASGLTPHTTLHFSLCLPLFLNNKLHYRNPMVWQCWWF